MKEGDFTQDQDTEFETKLATLGSGFARTAKAVLLREGEKRAMRTALVSFMEAHPAPEVKYSSLNPRTRTAKSAYSVRKLIRDTLAGLIAAGLVGGTVSYAAEGSLPGEWLYPVKTEVNESVRVALAASPEGRAALHVSFAERRLEEAEHLAVEGRLTAETQAIIVEKFAQHAEEAGARSETSTQENIEIEAALMATSTATSTKEEGESESAAREEEEEGAEERSADLSSNFESLLEAHEKVLAKIEAKQPEASEHLEAVLGDVRVRLAIVSEKREETEKKLSARGSERAKALAEAAMRSAGERIAEAEKFLESVKGTLSGTTTASIEARIRKAKETFAQAEAKFNVGAHSEAFALFKKSERGVKSVKFLARAAEEFEIEINGVHATGTISASTTREIAIPDGTVKVTGDGIEIRTEEHEEDEDGESVSTTSVRVHVEGDGGVRVYSSSSAKGADGGSASVRVEQKIQVNTGGVVEVRN